ncbi:ATP-binding protein [Acidobacteriota bacterium]
MSLNLINWKLRQKIILHVVVIGLTTALLLIYVYWTTQRGLMREINIQRSELVGSMIERNVIFEMDSNQSGSIHPALQEIVESANLSSIRIIDLDGKILNSSRSQEIGQYIAQENRGKLKNIYSDLEDAAVYSLKPLSPTESFLAIRNRDECFKCHAPDNNVIGILDVNLDDSRTSAILWRNQFKGFVIAFISLVVLIYIIFRLFDKIVNRPISRLKDHMKRVQEGDLEAHLEPRKNDEIGDLTRSFNAMVKNLKEANSKLEEMHNKEMEKAGHLASIGEIAAGLAHEIKNPIAGIKGALEVIAEKTDTEDPKKEIFHEMIVQIERIHTIVKDLLNYAKPKETELRPADPNECALQAIKLAEAQTKEKNIKFAFEGLPGDELMLLDTDKMQEVLLNLMLNSVEAINEAGEISIKIGIRDNERCIIILQDTGKGIKSEHLSQVFNPFFTTRGQGTGLGLSICRRIINTHQGDIQVSSLPGRGTTFTIDLPIVRKQTSP